MVGRDLSRKRDQEEERSGQGSGEGRISRETKGQQKFDMVIKNPFVSP